MEIKTLNASDDEFDKALEKLLSWDASDDKHIVQTVTGIIDDIRKQGDAALFSYTEKFDNWPVSKEAISVDKEHLKQAWDGLSKQVKDALSVAADRIRQYAEHQIIQPWSFADQYGNTLGQKITPLKRVGVYVPGGKAAYPSSVLMNVIPAKVAGVDDIIMVTPTPNGQLNDMVLAAAYISGVDQVLRVGGAQAVAALAYGTETVPAVDKIVGPGNIYVATAKKMVFGQVGIDMVAGPSEILIICDGKTDPDWIAMDLFSQAEHDENAQAILVSLDEAYIDAVKQSIKKLLPSMERAAIITRSLEQRGAFICASTKAEAIDVANAIAPEHLELSVDDPEEWVEAIEHAGAIFMGRYTPEALGDYCAGPNHVLPTSGTARFSSPLGVYDFQKRSSVIHCTQQGGAELARVASTLATGESLMAHAQSAQFRQLK